jgi:transcriptional regulator with XRE-family HTH domain
VLRARRQGQHRTLREVSTAANVSLGYLSEIERGQKEASSELLAAICDALGSHLSDVLRDVSDSLARVEGTVPALTGAALPEPEHAEAATAGAGLAEAVLTDAARRPTGADAPLAAATADGQAHTVSDGTVSVCVRRNGPLRTTLHAVRTRRPGVARTGELTRPAS